MPLRDDLLTPVPGDNPSGPDLRYDPAYDKLKEARRQDDDLPQGDWATERKTADYGLVLKVGQELLATKTKDLQIAAWLTEALLKREGFAGFAAGLQLQHDLLERFWDTLHPELEDGDAELRASPLEWIASKLDIALRQAPLNRAGHGYLQYVESRALPTEEAAENDRDVARVREAAIEEGKLLPEEFDKSLAETPKAFYKQLAADLVACVNAVDALDAIASERFGDVAPSFRRLRDTLDELQRGVRVLLNKKLETDPDPIEETAADTMGADGEAPGSTGEVTVSAPAGGPLAPEPVSVEDAASRVVGAARYLRRHAPGNPAAFLLLRGLRWGEVRGGRTADGSPEPRLLVAPPTALRAQLKGHLLDGKWPELLELAESVMATPAGRGWLDLQRYVLTACDALGAEYAAAGAAIRTALAALLHDFPQLVETTLMDDTPTANAETRAWLAEEQLLPSAGDGSDGVTAADAAADAFDGAALDATDGTDGDGLAHVGNGSGTGNGHGGALRRRALAWSPYDLAMAEVRAGRPHRGIELLMREVARERSKRGRFIRRTQVARIMVDSGLEAVALPILEELAAQIEEFRLQEWEAGDLVAQPLALLWRCLDKLDRDEDTKQELYLRICRLDPVQAIAFTTR
jgi:type VI secretion system protein ImpA